MPDREKFVMAVLSGLRSDAGRARIARPLRSLAAVLDLWRNLARTLRDPYRPELHYMRGPGPKWRETHHSP